MASAKLTALRGVSSEKDRKLSRDAWLDGAQVAIAEGGFDNVRVLTLAKRLRVTRGSFYWHFKDHAEFIVSFLDRWRDRRLGELDYLSQSGGDGKSELRHVFRQVLSEPARTTRQMRIELAVRDFARRDSYAAKTVAEVDRARIDHCARLIAQSMTDKQRARDLALLVYVATIGGRVVLTSSRDGEAAISRMDDLIGEILAARGTHR
jgi:AcrR family transcriptional regulator